MQRKRKSIARKRYPDRYHLVCLRLCGMNFDPAKITKALGLEGVFTQPSADLKIKSRRIYNTKLGHWNLHSRLRRSARVQSHVRDILEQIRPKKRALRRILKNVDADLNIAIEPHPDLVIAGYLFSAEDISEFTSLGLTFTSRFMSPARCPKQCQ